MKSKLTVCKSCGKEIAKSARACPACGAKVKRLKVWHIALIVVGLIIVLAALGGGEDKPQQVTAPQDGATSSPAPDKDVFAVGEAAELKNVIVTLKSVTESDGSDFFKPDDGNIFVLCTFEIENNSDKEIAISSLVSFEAYVDDYSTSMSLNATASREGGEQLDGSVAPGKKMAGTIGYEGPEGWKELEVSITPDFWGGKGITFLAESGK